MMKRAIVLFCASIALCSFGCGQKDAAPLVLEHHDCPAPQAPILPELDAALPLDSPENITRLLLRDDMIRTYIDGLESALQCEQARGGPCQTK